MSEFVPKRQHLREVLLQYYLLKKSAVLMWISTVTMLHRSQFTDFGSYASKVVISMSTTKSAMFSKQTPKRETDIDLCQTLQELSAALDVDQSTAGKLFHTQGMVQKAGNWIPHELQERGIEMFDYVGNAASMTRKKAFCIGSSLAMKNGFTTTILNASSMGGAR
ncbi:hypothetical protein Trydic_g4366 [Trypoxylus dichotomus]